MAITPETTQSLVAAAAAGLALVLRETLDQVKTRYRQHKTGDRRKGYSTGNGHGTAEDGANLRALIKSEAEATRSALKAHADEDAVRFQSIMDELALIRTRSHDAANTLAATVAKVELIIQNRIKH